MPTALYQLPLGVIGVAIGVVLLPTLERASSLKAGDHIAEVDQREPALEFALFLTLPAPARAVPRMAEPIMRVLFERGAFAVDTLATPRWSRRPGDLRPGLPAFVLIKVFIPAISPARTPRRR